MRQLKITKSITNRESQSLEKYLQEIGKVDLLTPEEEVDLAKRIKQGDQIALEKLTKANLRFVVSVAKQYQNQGLSLSDLINEGNLGLIKAAQRFDETRGFKFISYAVWWIRQSILQALAEQSRIVRLPLNKVGSLNKINKAFSELEQTYEREPSPEELAELLEITSDEVETTSAWPPATFRWMRLLWKAKTTRCSTYWKTTPCPAPTSTWTMPTRCAGKSNAP
jgi:RNA polymerase primary sigma factor